MTVLRWPRQGPSETPARVARHLQKRKKPRGRVREASVFLTGPDYGTKQLGSPSPAVEIVGFVVFTPMPQVAPDSWLCVTVADQ